MRFLLVLFALLAAPFALSVAQGQSHSTAHCAALGAVLKSTPANAQALASALKKCPSAELPPPPPPAGTVAIDGRATYMTPTGRQGLVNWVVTLSGTVNTTKATDGSGNYAFTGLPAGHYAVCLEVQAGWVLTSPGSWGAQCPTGFGYFFTLADMESATWVTFTAAVAP